MRLATITRGADTVGEGADPFRDASFEILWKAFCKMQEAQSELLVEVKMFRHDLERLDRKLWKEPRK